jgi:hypothetical protein
VAESHFHRVLRARVAEVLDARSQSIASGACATHDHYQHEVGFIAGLRAALELAEDLERDMDA